MNISRKPGKILLSTLILGSLLVLSAGCKKSITSGADSLYVPSASDVTSTATLADLQAGYSVYVGSCGRCHGLYSPDNYTAARWKTIVPGMASKAGLSAAQTAQVTKYVTRGL